MSFYTISQIYPSDERGNGLIDELLRTEGIRRDANLDYVCAMFNEQGKAVATGSCYGNTLRCLAVSDELRGEGLMSEVVTHLMEVQFARGHQRLFLYTRSKNASLFNLLGFYEVARVNQHVVFMENRKSGFEDYLASLTSKMRGEKRAALVMNANPFTLGHQYLIEKAALENDVLHLFIVSEDVSLVPYAIRKQLVIEGTAHLSNICYHDAGPYIISNATFPSYFQKDEDDVIMGHALLDVAIFIQIAAPLGITRRYVGEEPTSRVTALYNQIMLSRLPGAGIECVIVPRKEIDGHAISASSVRQAIKDGDMAALGALVPETTLSYFLSPESALVIEAIRHSGDVVHY